MFPDLGCPLSGRGSSKPFLPASTCCSAPSCPSSPHRSAEPALWPLTHCKLKSILPAPAGHRDARRLIRTRPAAVPGAPGILLLRVPAHVSLAPSDITLIPSWKTILMSLQRGRVEAGPEELCFRNCSVSLLALNRISSSSKRPQASNSKAREKSAQRADGKWQAVSARC